MVSLCFAVVGLAVLALFVQVPLGRLADRVGRGRVFIGGYVVLLAVYASLLLPSIGAAGVVVYLGLFGTFYAATDGVLMALASSVLPSELRGTGLGFIVTFTTIGGLVASIAFGALWTTVGIDMAVVGFGAALVVAIAVAIITLMRTSQRSEHEYAF